MPINRKATEETKEKIRIALKKRFPNGRPINNGCFKKGHKNNYTPEWKAKQSKVRIRLIKEGKIDMNAIHTERWRNIMSLKMKGRKRSIEAIEKAKITKRENFNKGLLKYNYGYKNHRWKGGITPIHNKIRCLPKMKDWSRKVLERDRFKCIFCGVNNKTLTAHHIIFLSYLLHKYNIKTCEETINCPFLWDLTNGLTLCFSCHKDLHKIAKKIPY